LEIGQSAFRLCGEL